MPNFRTLFHLLRADFLERVRGYGFLVLLLFTVFLTYIFIPEINDAQVAGLNLGGYRAIYNSAWIGTMTTLLMGEFFLLFVFYLIKGSVERDRRTGVGQILAATPLTKVKYTLGKWLSNVAVVTAMTLAIILATILLQLLRAEDTHINLWQLASPFLIVLFPALAVIAATAVLFDCIPLLRGGVGNVLFFFIAYPILTLSLDLQGNTILYPSIYQACASQFSNCNPTRQIDAGLPPLADYPAFTYDGVTWTSSVLIFRFAIILLGVFIALLAAWLFHRFDPAKADKTLFGNFSLKRTPAPQAMSNSQALTQPQKQTPLISSPQGTPLDPAYRPSAFSSLTRLFAAEIRLTLKEKSWFWYLCAIGLFIALALTPLDVAQLYLLPLAFVLPLTIWSNLGVREVKHRAEEIIFSAPRLLTRQLPITLLTGIFVAFILTSPLLLRFIFAGKWSSLGGLVVGIFFVPSLAMALGVWTIGSKLFEGGYLFLWYIASMYNIPALDFMGRVPVARQQGIPLAYLLVTVVLIFVIYFGRRKQAIKRENMAIDFRSEMPSKTQFWDLFQTTGWNETYHLSPSELFQAVSSNWFAVSAFDGDRHIGFGRVVSDGLLHAMIYEMIVLPEYQGQGVGAQILHLLVQKCLNANIRDIQLFCARGKRGFYEKYGFIARPDDSPGMQYIK